MQLRKRCQTHTVPYCCASHLPLLPISSPKEFGPEEFPSLNLHSPKPIWTTKSQGSLVETQHALTDPLAGRGSGDPANSNTTNSTDASLCGGDTFVRMILSLSFASEANPGPVVRATADVIRSTWAVGLLALLRIDLGSCGTQVECNCIVFVCGGRLLAQCLFLHHLGSVCRLVVAPCCLIFFYNLPALLNEFIRFQDPAYIEWYDTAFLRPGAYLLILGTLCAFSRWCQLPMGTLASAFCRLWWMILFVMTLLEFSSL